MNTERDAHYCKFSHATASQSLFSELLELARVAATTGQPSQFIDLFHHAVYWSPHSLFPVGRER